MYAIKEAMSGMSRTPYMTLLSIVTITVTLSVLGLFTVVTLLGHGTLRKVRTSEEVNVYLMDDLSDGDMLALDAVIAAMPEVGSTRILSKEDARREFERLFGGDLLSVINENPLPRTIVVKLNEDTATAADLERIAGRIGKADGVESVEYGRNWTSNLDFAFVVFVIGELSLLSLALAACTLIISNTISMTVLARKETIEIMRLVGATDGFIRRPFYIEGFFQGLLSGIATYGVIYGVWVWLLRTIPNLDAYLYMFTLPVRPDLSVELAFSIIIPVGGLLGFWGSFVAVRRVF